MKKIIYLLLIIAAFEKPKAQNITIPVYRISVVANDTGSNASLLNVSPYWLLLSVTSGALPGNINMNYTIIDSIAESTPHITPFGVGFTRTCRVTGTIQFPLSVYASAFDSNNKPIVSVFNQMLGFMDMGVDTDRPQQFTIK